MKSLLLIRHAKSDWENRNLRDFDRPLNPRGERDAPEMAQRMVQKQLIPDVLISSPALRAITTAGYFASAWKMDPKTIQSAPSIYEASVNTLLNLVNQLDNRYTFVALTGHNPGFTGLAGELSGADIYDVPTCGIVLIDFPFDDWQLVSRGTGELRLFDFPKNEHS